MLGSHSRLYCACRDCDVGEADRYLKQHKDVDMLSDGAIYFRFPISREDGYTLSVLLKHFDAQLDSLDEDEQIAKRLALRAALEKDVDEESPDSIYIPLASHHIFPTRNC